MPSWKLFDAQPITYQEGVLPPSVKARLAIEAGVTHGWVKYVGSTGEVLGLDRFGASAPHQVLMEKLGFTPERIVERVLRLLDSLAVDRNETVDLAGPGLIALSKMSL